jgi:hypothetical protein
MPSPLSKYFTGIGAKRLSNVEVNPDVSHQHEFNGIIGFKAIFGTEKIDFKGRFIYLSDHREQILEDSGKLTWYDSRENDPKRTEHRLYYSPNLVIASAEAGDLLIIGKTGIDRLAVIVAPEGSTSEQQLLYLFGLEEVGSGFVIRDYTENDIQLDFAGRFILTSLGFEMPDTAPDYLEDILLRFGEDFPGTAEFSEFARSTLKDSSPVEEADNTLLALMEREELLFRTLEKHIVRQKLQQGFGEDDNAVDRFISLSLSVQNRRKARAGFAFEHHLAYIFDSNRLSYSNAPVTERNNRPDFLFPGIHYYKNPEISTTLLTMLGVKTTAKERWRQILSEADRIQGKHLITLEPAISRNQTDEMIAQNVQLVIPGPLMVTFSAEQQVQLISLSDFIHIVQDKQARIR